MTLLPDANPVIMAKSLAPNLRRFYREIGLCVNCTLSRTGLCLPNPSSAYSKAPICQICNSKGVHTLDCPSLHEHEHDAKVWTHDPSNIPSFDTRFFDQLLCTVSLAPSAVQMWPVRDLKNIKTSTTKM